MIRTALTSVFLAGAMISSWSPAMAQESQTQRISYGDLNLANPTGAAAFESRVRRAIVTVCPDSGSAGLREMMEIARCRSQARTGVQQQMAHAYAEQKASPAAQSIVLASR